MTYRNGKLVEATEHELLACYLIGRYGQGNGF